MDERVYENLITRHAPSWNAPPQAASGLLAGLPPSAPTGKPTNAEFPTSASTPPVSIMNPEPPLGARAEAAVRRHGRAASGPGRGGDTAGAGRSQEATAAAETGAGSARADRCGAHS